MNRNAWQTLTGKFTGRSNRSVNKLPNMELLSDMGRAQFTPVPGISLVFQVKTMALTCLKATALPTSELSPGGDDACCGYGSAESLTGNFLTLIIPDSDLRQQFLGSFDPDSMSDELTNALDGTQEGYAVFDEGPVVVMVEETPGSRGTGRPISIRIEWLTAREVAERRRNAGRAGRRSEQSAHSSHLGTEVAQASHSGTEVVRPLGTEVARVPQPTASPLFLLRIVGTGGDHLIYDGDVIGRNNGAASGTRPVLPYTTASARHFAVCRNIARDIVVIRDMGSTNGTLLQLPSGEQVVLHRDEEAEVYPSCRIGIPDRAGNPQWCDVLALNRK